MYLRTTIETRARPSSRREVSIKDNESQDDDDYRTAGDPDADHSTRDWVQTGPRGPRHQRSDPGPLLGRSKLVYHDDGIGGNSEAPGVEPSGGSTEEIIRESFERLLRGEEPDMDRRLESRSVFSFYDSAPASEPGAYGAPRGRSDRQSSPDSPVERTSPPAFRPRTRREVVEHLRHLGNIAFALTEEVNKLHDDLDYDEFETQPTERDSVSDLGGEGNEDEGQTYEEEDYRGSHHQGSEEEFEGQPERKSSPERPVSPISKEQHLPTSNEQNRGERAASPTSTRTPVIREREAPRPPNKNPANNDPHAYKAGAKHYSGENEAHRVLEDVVNMGRPRARNLTTKEYDDVVAYTNERYPHEPLSPPNGSNGSGKGGRGGGGGGGRRGDGGDFGFTSGDPRGTAAKLIREGTGVRLIFFRYDKGKVVKCNQPPEPIGDSWDNELLSRAVRRNYAASRNRLSRLFSKVRFLYFIKVSYDRDEWENKVIRATYLDALPFESNRTVSRFIYLLNRAAKDDQSLTCRLITLRRTMDRTISVPFIYVEIMEGLSTRSILSVGLTTVVFSLVCGVAYAIPTEAWGDAFTLSGLLVACFALLLAVIAIYQYLGFERLIDDEIAARSGNYKYHPGHFGIDDMNA